MSEEAPEQGSEQESIPLAQASLQQLNVVKQQLEQDIKGLENNYAALREAEARFTSSVETLKSLVPENQGKPVLVPVTSSLYVDGEMSNTSTVVVDVGTGYFIEMSVAKANQFCDKRTKLLSNNASKVEKAVKEKRKQLETITMSMQQKYQKIQMEQEAMKERQG